MTMTSLRTSGITMFDCLKLDKDNDEAKQMRVLRSPVMYSMARYLRAACKVGKCGSTNVCVDVSVSVCLCLPLSVSVWLCVSVYFCVSLGVTVCFCVFLSVSVCHIHIVRMQCCARCMFFFGIHMDGDALQRPKSFVRIKRFRDDFGLS